MQETKSAPFYHLNDPDWRYTPKGEKRGYIQPTSIHELWFNVGTSCNLSCPFCFEGSRPGNNRLQPLTLCDIRPFIDEAVALGTQQFSFTGGEPFVNPETIQMLDYALDFNPCLVLTNATEPLQKQLSELAFLRSKPNPLSFRVSLDFPCAKMHDRNRGEGHFNLSVEVMGALYQMGFHVSIARQADENEDAESINSAYRLCFRDIGLPEQTPIISFSDLARPGAHLKVPQITENCMKTYKTQEQREKFMCNYSKMVVKKEGQVRVSSCTLVDDDAAYDVGNTLNDAMRARIMLRHHRCFGCFSQGTSCSEGI